MQTVKELLALQWGNPKMVDYCLKSSIYIETSDGAFIDVGNAKPGIDSDMWYDDETDGPAVTFENFRAYNMRSNAPTPLRESAHFVTTQYNNDKTNNKLLCFTISMGSVRPATEDEIKRANEALAKALVDYEKRLERYWKRYSDKVYARGYYANR